MFKCGNSNQRVYGDPSDCGNYWGTRVISWSFLSLCLIKVVSTDWKGRLLRFKSFVYIPRNGENRMGSTEIQPLSYLMEAETGKSYFEWGKISFQVDREYLSPLIFMRIPVKSKRETRVTFLRRKIGSLILDTNLEACPFKLTQVPSLIVPNWNEDSMITGRGTNFY